jgi:transcriptional antiterminator NusG
MTDLEEVEEGVSEEMEAPEEAVPVEEETVVEEEPVVETYSQRSDGFVAFIRHEDKVLLMQRADGVADFPSAWDGVYGVGDSRDLDAVVTRIEQATGLSAANLTHVRSGKPRGVEMGNRLYDITPILFMSESTEIEPRTLYKNAEWIDPGSIQDKSYCVSQLGELYGDVSAYLYIVKTTIGQEEKVAREMKARLSGTGSLQDIQDEIYGVLYPTIMRGYIFVEASAFHHVEKLIGRAGGRTTPLKNCSRVLPGTAPLGDVTPYLEPKAATAGIEEGDIVEIRVGAFKGERARVTNIAETKEEVTVELFEAAVPIPITVRADQVRVTQRVD